MVITKAPCSGLCSAPLERKNNPSSNQWTDTEMGTGAARGKWEGFCQQKRQKPVKAMSSGTILWCYHRNHAKWQPSAFYYFITRLSLKRALFLFLVIVWTQVMWSSKPSSEAAEWKSVRSQLPSPPSIWDALSTSWGPDIPTVETNVMESQRCPRGRKSRRKDMMTEWKNSPRSGACDLRYRPKGGNYAPKSSLATRSGLSVSKDTVGQKEGER